MIDNSSKFISPVFIVGVPRSGTTVFSMKLAEAAGIAMAPETHFMPEVWAPLRHLDLNDNKAIQTILSRFSAGRWFEDLGLPVELIKKKFAEQNDHNWATLFNLVLRLYADKTGNHYWGEKTPGHYHYVSELLAWYPSCRLIFVMRDPRAVVASNLRAPFAPPYVWFTARRWCEVTAIFLRQKKDPRISMVRYEDFITDSEAILANICDWLDLAPVDNSSKNKLPTATTTEGNGWRVKHLQLAGKTIHNQSISRWRNQLNDYEIWLTEKITRPALGQFGYESTKAKQHTIKYWVRFITTYPMQRQKLTISWAMNPLLDAKNKHSIKARLMRGIGTIWDGLLLFCFKFTRFSDDHKGNDNKVVHSKGVIVTLGKQHLQASSFHPLSPENEILGMFISELQKSNYEIHLAVLSNEQFFAARKIIQNFSLAAYVKIIPSKTNVSDDNAHVEMYHLKDNVPPLHVNDLDINALNVIDTVHKLNVFFIKCC